MMRREVEDLADDSIKTQKTTLLQLLFCALGSASWGLPASLVSCGVGSKYSRERWELGDPLHLKMINSK